MANRSDSFFVLVGDRIREARRQIGLTQEELAAQVQLSRSSVTNIELGQQNVKLDTLCRIAVVLKVALADLVPDSNAGAAGGQRGKAFKTRATI